MIRLGLRLALGSRESIVRLVVTALAVAVGVAMLLAALASINAIGAQDSRGAWLATMAPPHRARATASVTAAAHSPSPLWWLVTTDEYQDQFIVHVDVAATGASSPVPPGIPRLPRPGQYYASPALAALLRSVPANELARQFPGRRIGVIGASAIPSPADLIAIVGETTHALAAQSGAGEVTSFATSSGAGGPDTLGSTTLEAVLGLLGLVLLFPLLIFIATATRLSAARREQRFAAIRLVGGTMRQVTIAAAVEAALAAGAGVALGLLVFIPLRPALTHASFTGQPFALGDLTLHIGDFLAVVVGVPMAAVAAARVALRRVRITPLGVSRRATPPAPRLYRILPLVAGIGELAYFVAVGHPQSSNGQLLAYFTGFLLVMVGLVVAGPWLTMAGSRLMVRRTSRPSMLLAGRRIADNPRGTFRAISGLILALFVTSTSIGLVTTLLVDHGETGAASSASRTVTDQFSGKNQSEWIPSFSSQVAARLRSIPGVSGLTIVYRAPEDLKIDGPVPDINGIGGDITYGLVSCRQLATTPAIGRCLPGAAYAAVGEDLSFMPMTKPISTAAATTWPTALPTEGLAGLPVKMVAVATNGSETAIARVETTLEQAYPTVSSTSIYGQLQPQDAQLLDELRSVSEVVVVVSLVIAGCSMAIATAGGVIERRRPFSLLRLSGAPVSVLRRVVAFETILPLFAVSLLSVTLGLVASDLFLRSQLDLTLRMPSLAFYGIILGGLAVSLLIIGTGASLIEPLTRPEDARWE